MDEKEKRKNILDLHFQKHLNILSTSVIVGFTYFLGIGIAIITKQIDLGDFVAMIFVGILSTVVLGVCSFFILNSKYHLRNIPEIIKDL